MQKKNFFSHFYVKIKVKNDEKCIMSPFYFFFIENNNCNILIDRDYNFTYFL